MGPSPTHIHACINIYVHTHIFRHGVLLHHELNSLPDLLTRLGRVHSLFTKPHPLTKTVDEQLETKKEVGGVEQATANKGTLQSVEAFHRGFLNYLVENRFFSLMYHYLDCYG